jgi:spore coat polysaccharide biosynthesis protein SpsF
MNKVVIIIQARMGSTRLPGKVIKRVSGIPLLLLQYQRLSLSKLADQIVIATSTNPNDSSIVKLCLDHAIMYFKGSESDVLKRYYDAATFFKADIIVRINSDCPLIDPRVVDKVINAFLSSGQTVDYASNILEETYPTGMHVEVFSYNAIKKASERHTQLDEKEHVTPYIYRNPSIFKLLSVTNSINLSMHRWTVDYEEDFEFISQIIKKKIKNNIDTSMNQIVEFLDNNPKLLEINSMHSKKQNLL